MGVSLVFLLVHDGLAHSVYLFGVWMFSQLQVHVLKYLVPTRPLVQLPCLLDQLLLVLLIGNLPLLQLFLLFLKKLLNLRLACLFTGLLLFVFLVLR